MVVTLVTIIGTKKDVQFRADTAWRTEATESREARKMSDMICEICARSTVSSAEVVEYQLVDMANVLYWPSRLANVLQYVKCIAVLVTSSGG